MKRYSFILFLILSGKITSILCIRNPDFHLEGHSFTSLNSGGQEEPGPETSSSGLGKETQENSSDSLSAVPSVSRSDPGSQGSEGQNGKEAQGVNPQQSEGNLGSKTEVTEETVKKDTKTQESQPSEKPVGVPGKPDQTDGVTSQHSETTQELRQDTSGKVQGSQDGGVGNGESLARTTDSTTVSEVPGTVSTQNPDSSRSTSTLRTEEPAASPGPPAPPLQKENVPSENTNSTPSGVQPSKAGLETGSSSGKAAAEAGTKVLPSSTSEPTIHPTTDSPPSPPKTPPEPAQSNANPTQPRQQPPESPVTGRTVEAPIKPVVTELANSTRPETPAPSALDNLPTLEQDTGEANDQNPLPDKESKVKEVLLASLKELHRNIETHNRTELALPPEDYFKLYPKSFCKTFKITKPLVCSLNTDKTQLTDLINDHYVDNICSTENSVTQLYNEDGNFSYKLLEKYLEQFKKKAPSKTMQDVYDKSVPVVTKLAQLMKNTETALVSENIKHLFDKRNLLLTAALCGVVSDEQSIMSSTEYSSGHVVLTVNEESLIEETTTLFMKAYQPMVDLLKEFNLLLPKLLDLFEEGFENKINLLTSMANVVPPKTQPPPSAARPATPPSSPGNSAPPNPGGSNSQAPGSLPPTKPVPSAPNVPAPGGGLDRSTGAGSSAGGEPAPQVQVQEPSRADGSGRSSGAGVDRTAQAEGQPGPSGAGSTTTLASTSGRNSLPSEGTGAVHASGVGGGSGSPSPPETAPQVQAEGKGGSGVVPPAKSPDLPQQGNTSLETPSGGAVSALQTGSNQKSGSALLQFFGDDDKEIAAVHGHPSLIQRFKSLLQLKTTPSPDPSKNQQQLQSEPGQTQQALQSNVGQNQPGSDARTGNTGPITGRDSSGNAVRQQSQVSQPQQPNPPNPPVSGGKGDSPPAADVKNMDGLQVLNRTTPGGVNNSDHSTQRTATSALTGSSPPSQPPSPPRPEGENDVPGIMTRLKTVFKAIIPGKTAPEAQSKEEALKHKERNHQKEQELLKEALKHFAYLDIFKTNQGKLLAELDEQKIKALVRSNLLSLNNFDPMYNLVVAPQRAVHSLYKFVERLLLSPDADERITNLNDSKILEQIKNMVEPLEDLYEQIKEHSQELQLRMPNLHGQEGQHPPADHHEPTHRHHNTAGNFLLVSNASGVKLSEDLLGKSKGPGASPFKSNGTFTSITVVLISSVLLDGSFYGSKMLNNLPNETDSVLLANPKFIKDEQHNAFANLLSFDESLLYSSGHFSSRNELISCIVAMLHGVEVLTYLPIMYLYKDDFKVSPAMLTFILGLIRIPLNIKLLFAFMSDAVPIFGSRRRSYLAIGSFICFVSMFTLGLLNEDYSIVLTTALFALCSLGSALCSVIGEALVIECAYKQSNDQVTKTISTFYTFRKLTFAAMSYLSSVLIMMIKKRQIFMIASSLPFCVFFTSFFIQEKPFGGYLTIKDQYHRLLNFASKPEIKNPSIFLFVCMIIPSAGTAMFYFMTERLHFQPELFGRFAAIQAIASLFGIYCYLMFFRNVSIRTLFVWTTHLVAVFCIFSIMLVKRWNLKLGIPDKAFAITDTSLIQFIGELNSFPIYVMATRLCPRGIESSMYSFLWTVQFLGMDISTYISSGLTHLLKIEKNHFEGLVPLIVLCGLAQLIPNLLVGMLPEQLPTVQLEEEVGACIDDATPDPPAEKVPIGSDF